MPGLFPEQSNEGSPSSFVRREREKTEEEEEEHNRLIAS